MVAQIDAVLLVICCCLCLLGISRAGEIENLNCQVCRAVVDETLFRISKVDPKKTIQAGSFRVDSHGNQARYEAPYARSETHLTELFEEICTHMHNYGETTDDKGRTSIVRTSSKEEKPIQLTGIIIDPYRQKKYIAACDALLEDYEEDMMVVFKRKDLPQFVAEQKVCVDISEYCTVLDLEIPMPNPTLEEQETDVIKELEKTLAETAQKTANPAREDSKNEQTDEQMTSQTDIPDEATDKIEL